MTLTHQKSGYDVDTSKIWIWRWHTINLDMTLTHHKSEYDVDTPNKQQILCRALPVHFSWTSTYLYTYPLTSMTRSKHAFTVALATRKMFYSDNLCMKWKELASNSSYNLFLFVPFHVPVMNKAAWYWIRSMDSISECKVIDEQNWLDNGGIW